MSEPKFTKKMEIGNSTDDAPFCVDGFCNLDGELFEVCSVWGVDDYIEECDQSKANAHLIAAAPEMYNLINDLRHAVSMGGIGGGINNIEVLKSMDELLAKARGEL